MGWSKLHAVSLLSMPSRTGLKFSLSVSVKGTAAAEWDKNTWPSLEELARNHPEAGVHFQGYYRQSRAPAVTVCILIRLRDRNTQ